jgi:hypothetical protein
MPWRVHDRQTRAFSRCLHCCVALLSRANKIRKKLYIIANPFQWAALAPPKASQSCQFSFVRQNPPWLAGRWKPMINAFVLRVERRISMRQEGQWQIDRTNRIKVDGNFYGRVGPHGDYEFFPSSLIISFRRRKSRLITVYLCPRFTQLSRLYN